MPKNRNRIRPSFIRFHPLECTISNPAQKLVYELGPGSGGRINARASQRNSEPPSIPPPFPPGKPPSSPPGKPPVGVGKPLLGMLPVGQGKPSVGVGRTPLGMLKVGNPPPPPSCGAGAARARPARARRQDAVTDFMVSSFFSSFLGKRVLPLPERGYHKLKVK